MMEIFTTVTTAQLYVCIGRCSRTFICIRRGSRTNKKRTNEQTNKRTRNEQKTNKRTNEQKTNKKRTNEQTNKKRTQNEQTNKKRTKNEQTNKRKKNEQKTNKRTKNEQKTNKKFFLLSFVFLLLLYSSCHLLHPALAYLSLLVPIEVRFGCKYTLAFVTEYHCWTTGAAVPPLVESCLGRCSIYFLA